jgi:hypothetical protein
VPPNLLATADEVIELTMPFVEVASVCNWPQAPFRGDAAIWPLSVEHRTVGDEARTAALDSFRTPRSFGLSAKIKTSAHGRRG